MTTHGLLSQVPAPAPGGAATLPDDAPALHVELRGRAVTAASPAVAELLGCDPENLVGRPLADLFAPQERAAIERRIDDVVLLGRDVFGALALGGPTVAEHGVPVWVEADARYLYHGGQRLEIRLRPIEDGPRRAVERSNGATLPPAIEPDPVDVPAGLAAPMAPAAVSDEPSAPEAMPEPADEPLAVPVLPAHPALVAIGDELPPVVSLPATEPDGDGTAASMGASEIAGGPVEVAAEVAPPVATMPSDTLALVMAALEASGAAALAVGQDGAVASATPEAERLLATPIARLRGAALAGLLALPEPAASALSAARTGRMRQTVLADLADGDGRVVLDWVPGAEPGAGYAVLATDVPASETSERLRLQARLVSFVTHDVRESLAAVYCGLRTLADELPGDAPARPFLDRALSESRRANRIVDDVLAVSRPGRLTRVELELDGVLRETITRFRPRAAAAGVEVHEELRPGIVVSADLSSLERAFGNLVENALQATPHYGTLQITSVIEDRARPGVRVSIADTGVGIKPDMRPNIFEPFVTDKASGTGLGLAITRRVVLDHEGQIDFEAEEGRGTTFHIWLPRLAP